MAVTKTEFNVNSGNAGWTAQQVLETLETALGPTGAGHHSGASTSGVVRKIVKPTDGWDQIGGVVPIATQSTPDRTWNSGFTDSGTYYNEWDYTDPSPPSGGTACQITVRRYGSIHQSSYQGQTVGVFVKTPGSGYTNGYALTIPAANIGGTGGADIVFSTNSATVAEIKVLTTQGGTSNWWWKDTDAHANHGSWASQIKSGVCRVTNDAAKTYGTTYYSFSIVEPGSSRPGLICFKSAVGFDPTLTNHGSGNSHGYQGGFTGEVGMDNFGTDYLQTVGNGSVPAAGTTLSAISRSSLASRIRFIPQCFTNTSTGLPTSSNNYGSYGASLVRGYCRTTTPKDYPIKIVTYKADATQDNRYCIIQFQQVVAGDVETYLTFSLNVGTQWGQNIWDLDHVFQGGLSFYRDSSRPTQGTATVANSSGADLVAISTTDCIQDKNHDYSDNMPNHFAGSPVSSSTRMRECLYGYDKYDPAWGQHSPHDWREDHYLYNFAGRDSNDGGLDSYDSSEIRQYHRNDTFDKIIYNSVNYKVDAAANFHKPIKGLPISSNMFPCPYYLPDDFVMIQLAVTPGATVVKSGDTITVSGSEVYTVVECSGSTNQTLYDNASVTVSTWICFCARTT